MSAAAKLIETHTKGAEIYHGAAVCKEKIIKILEEFFVPTGLLQLDEVEELGFNRPAGFFWLKQKKKNEHRFKSIGQTVVYDVQITAFIEEKHLTRMTGVKAKEMFIQVGLCEIIIGAPTSDKIKCVTASGISRAYPISAFELEQHDEIKNGK